MVNHMEYDPNFRTFKHVDKFAARGMVKENQREGAKAELEWEMKRAQRREMEKDMPKDNDYFRKMYMNREEVAEPEMTRWVDRVKKPGDAFMAAAKKAQRYIFTFHSIKVFDIVSTLHFITLILDVRRKTFMRRYSVSRPKERLNWQTSIETERLNVVLVKRRTMHPICPEDFLEIRSKPLEIENSSLLSSQSTLVVI